MELAPLLESLEGGRITLGVARVGDTVRRPRTQNSDFVDQLLRRLEAAGFEGAPRALGKAHPSDRRNCSSGTR
jgi:hypothetical protein